MLRRYYSKTPEAHALLQAWPCYRAGRRPLPVEADLLRRLARAIRSGGYEMTFAPSERMLIAPIDPVYWD